MPLADLDEQKLRRRIRELARRHHSRRREYGCPGVPTQVKYKIAKTQNEKY